MNKKHMILTLVLVTQIFVSGCSSLGKLAVSSQQTTATPTPASTPSAAANNSGIIIASTATPVAGKTPNVSISTAVSVSKEDLLTYSYMTKADLIKIFGDQIKTDGSTLTFSNGLTFYGLVNNQSNPNIIKCTDSVSIMGIQNGMTFDKVEAVMGKANIIETYIGTKDNKAYKIQYTVGKDIFKVLSTNKDGKNSYIAVCPQ